MTAAGGTSRRLAGRLIRFGLPGVFALLLLVATIAVFVSSRPAAVPFCLLARPGRGPWWLCAPDVLT